MDRRGVLKALAGFALCPVCANLGIAEEAAHWSYEGAQGPGHWGDLDPADRVCANGGQQSPIVIDSSIKAQLAPLKFAWARQAETIINNGHTIQLNFKDGGTLTKDSGKYTLVQFHFHHPSEHHIDGKGFPMEVHFVHRSEEGSLGVVGVMLASQIRCSPRSLPPCQRRKARRSRPLRALIRGVYCPRTAGIIFIPDR
jgi:carbonic anhydrase